MPLAPFGPATRTWFTSTFGAPTAVQRAGWPVIASGAHALLLAPTGSGKTLAAFLACLDRLTQLPPAAAPGVRVLYVSPLKALAYDLERNLRAPLAGVAQAAGALGLALRLPRVALRTGDTPAAARRAQQRAPAEILVTTPESLYLLLSSDQRETLREVQTVIVDEVHALAATKRGAHLALSLERLSHLTHQEPQRLGLSATARPVDEVARFLGGDRAVRVVDAGEQPRLELEVHLPAPAGPGTSVWPTIHAELLALVRAHRSTIIFVNNRGLCERLCAQLNALAGEALARAHHGSLAREQRLLIEEALKAGELRAIVATSSLELGIDMGAVELVVLVESPGSVARGLQRVGRAGHQVGALSRGRIFAKHRGDLLEAAVVARGMREGAIEALTLPRNPLDVLAQQIVAMCAMEPWSVPALWQCVRRAANFSALTRPLLESVLELLSGRYPSTDFADLRPRLIWDRTQEVLRGRPEARRLAVVAGGTIADRGLFAVHVAPDGRRIGELDEELVHETPVGQTIVLGAASWRITAVERDRVLVTPAPGEPGKLPFWHGEGPGRPIELGRALGAFVRELSAQAPGPARRRLQREYHLDRETADVALAYLAEQRAATGTLPSDRRLTIERFRDELGDWRVCLLSPFGARVHAPWALALEARLGGAAGVPLQSLWNDDGIALRFAETATPPDAALLALDPDQLEPLVIAQLARSALFAGRFRENAARALVLPRRRPGQRTPLWAQRLRAQQLQAVAQGFPDFPLVLETYRECLQDLFDLPALRELLRGIQRGEIAVDPVDTALPSPFARALVFAYEAAYLYQGDASPAERRAQALALDPRLLRELLGEEELRSLLDPAVIEETTAELQHCLAQRQAASTEALHDLLLRLGDLSDAELAARCRSDPRPWLKQLAREQRALRLRLAGEPRWIAAEDAGLYRDALGAHGRAAPPAAFLAAVADALPQLIARWARARGPFTSETLQRRYGLSARGVDEVLATLRSRGRIVGEPHPGAAGGGRAQPEHCDVEVLRRLKRRTLARLRAEVMPVPPAALGRLLGDWQALRPTGDGSARPQLPPPSAADPLARLRAVLAQLEGLPLALDDLDQAILPARVPGYHPRLLDELGANGELVWVGCGPLGAREGRVALFRRERVGLLWAPPPLAPGPAGSSAPADPLADPLRAPILAALARRGASFLGELHGACGSPPLGLLLTALRALSWAGLVTHDTLQPLRAAGVRGSVDTSRAGRRRAPPALFGGRWSLVSALGADQPRDPTERLHAWALLLLERYGVVSREAVAGEALPGGFAALYPVLAALERAGRVRRGHFVEGLSGAQFAAPGADERLRALRFAAAEPQLGVLAASDPANPYGTLLPWPPTVPQAGLAPGRRSGARVVLVDGELLLYLERGARSLLSWSAPDDVTTARLVLVGLAQLAAQQRGRQLRLERIDGEAARRSTWAPALLRAGWRADLKGLVFEAALGATNARAAPLTEGVM